MTPRWVTLEIADWMEHARTGELRFRFKNGIPVSMNRDEVVTPPPEHVEPAEEWTCPNGCSGTLVNYDFSSKKRCQTCEVTWTRHRLLELRAACHSARPAA